KSAAILKAEGDRQAAILRAEGFSLALDKIFAVAKNIDSKTLTLQYLEALKVLGAGASTKFIFPLEFTKLLQPLADLTRDNK
ncbi:MAG: SPFH domain-containing protein, partial [bacterium]